MSVAITGASSGIGAALAEQLHGAGARVAVCARRRDRLAALAHRLPGLLPIAADVAVEADCQRFIRETVAAFGRIDTLVCNAGYSLIRDIAETSRAEREAIFAANLHGTADCLAAAVPVMLAQEPRHRWRGQIVIVSSVLARRAMPAIGNYCATKSAQLSVAESARVELAPARIAVTSVHPVTTRTGLFAAAEQRSGRTSARRFTGQSADTVAACILAGIRRPRPEVWPAAWGRWVGIMSALWPAGIDRLVTPASWRK
jgi:short-subunit dehydrogenase